MKRISSKSGLSTLTAIVALAAAGLTVGGAIQMARVQERKSQMRLLAQERPASVIDAILSRVMSDLSKELVSPTGGGAADGTLDHLLKATSPVFHPTSPRIYGKGEFQLEVKDSSGLQITHGVPASGSSIQGSDNKIATKGFFIAPETDPRAWIESSNAACTYRLTVNVRVCTKIVAGRQRFPTTVLAPGLGKEFDPACPSEHLRTLNSQIYLNLASTSFASSAALKCGKVEDPNRNRNYSLLVLHSQQAGLEPVCYSGFKPLWSGYSFLGGFGGAKYRANQDLATVNSCLEGDSEIPFIHCDRDRCDYKTSSDRSLWLVSQASSGADFSVSTKDQEGREAALATVGRCTVCEGETPIMVRHSGTSTVPPCAPGWRLLWQGFSLLMASAEDEEASPQSLGDTGSCLKTFVPNPVVRCEDDKCQHGIGHQDQLWMVAKDTTSDLASHLNSKYFATNQGRIGRCSVCTKEY